MVEKNTVINFLSIQPIDLILDMLDEIRVAQKIENMVNGFNYDRLMEYLDSWQAKL